MPTNVPLVAYLDQFADSDPDAYLFVAGRTTGTVGSQSSSRLGSNDGPLLWKVGATSNPGPRFQYCCSKQVQDITEEGKDGCAKDRPSKDGNRHARRSGEWLDR